MKLLASLTVGTTLGQLSRFNDPAFRDEEEQMELSANWALDPLVQVRWDFGDCQKTGMSGPTSDDCQDYYLDTNLEDNVRISAGVQSWVVPADGLYLVTAAGPSGSSVSAGGRGRGAILEGNFHLMKGEIIDIIIGQISDYNLNSDPNSKRGLGGSGGTFVARSQDSKILMAAGGGGGGAGRKANVGLTKNVNDATDYPTGQNASIPLSGKAGRDYLGVGGENGNGGSYGVDVIGFDGTRKYGGGGGAGFGNLTGANDDGSGGQHPSDTRLIVRGAKNFLTQATGMNSRGTGGFIQFKPKGSRTMITNNGGFGGGGYGSEDGGAGGGGGYSGGAGGPPDGYSGGGGSLNNGFRQRNNMKNDGRGFVIISFIGKQCCGPVDVYIAMAFIAGILAKLLLTYFAYWAWRTAKRMHTSYVIISHLKELRKESQKLDADETLLIGRILEHEEDLKSRIGASRPDLRRRTSGRKRNHYETESYVTTDRSRTDESRTMSESQSETGTVVTARRLSSESASSPSTIVRQPVTSQALTNVTDISKASNQHRTEADSVLGGGTTLKSRTKLDHVNKSTRSGLYSTIGRNAVMPEEDDLDDDEEDQEEDVRSAPKKSFAKSNMSLAKSQRSGASGFGSRLSRPGTTVITNSHAARSARSLVSGVSDRGPVSARSDMKTSTSAPRRISKSPESRSYSVSKELNNSMSKSQLTLSDTNMSETNLSMSESQYSRSYQTGSDVSYSESYRSQTDRSEASGSTVNSQYRV